MDTGSLLLETFLENCLNFGSRAKAKRAAIRMGAIKGLSIQINKIKMIAAKLKREIWCLFINFIIF